MRNFLFAFLGAMGLTLLSLPIAVHESHRAAARAQQPALAVPANLVPVTVAGQIAADPQNDRDADRDAKADRDQNASDRSDKDPAADTSDSQPANRGATHQGQKTINVDLSDLVIRPV